MGWGVLRLLGRVAMGFDVYNVLAVRKLVGYCAFEKSIRTSSDRYDKICHEFRES